MSSSRDFRSLSPRIQAELRRVALKSVESGKTHQEAATVVGVHRQTVSAWVHWKRLSGEIALASSEGGFLVLEVVYLARKAVGCKLGLLTNIPSN